MRAVSRSVRHALRGGASIGQREHGGLEGQPGAAFSRQPVVDALEQPCHRAPAASVPIRRRPAAQLRRQLAARARAPARPAAATSRSRRQRQPRADDEQRGATLGRRRACAAPPPSVGSAGRRRRRDGPLSSSRSRTEPKRSARPRSSERQQLGLHAAPPAQQLWVRRRTPVAVPTSPFERRARASAWSAGRRMTSMR